MIFVSDWLDKTFFLNINLLINPLPPACYNPGFAVGFVGWQRDRSCYHGHEWKAEKWGKVGAPAARWRFCGQKPSSGKCCWRQSPKCRRCQVVPQNRSSRSVCIGWRETQQLQLQILDYCTEHSVDVLKKLLSYLIFPFLTLLILLQKLLDRQLKSKCWENLRNRQWDKQPKKQRGNKVNSSCL